MVPNVVMRISGAGALGVAGWGLGALISDGILPWALAFILGGALLGAVATPLVITNTFVRALDKFNELPLATLVSGTIGLIVGLVIASLISIPLFSLGGWQGWGIPIIISFSLGALGSWLGAHRGSEMSRVLPYGAMGAYSSPSYNGKILVDTSAIIDGRIADLGQTGFLEATLVFPRFVLDELRHVADSSDSLRRTRGRRGLEVLGKLQKDTAVPIQILDTDIEYEGEVDGQLVKLARSMKASILTTDFNLNRVAELQGVKVLNINELARALKPAVLQGEDLTVNIIQAGKEVGQGVAFLDDGTMVVVEGGRRYLHTVQDVTVTRVLQTTAGRIIFAQPKAG